MKIVPTTYLPYRGPKKSGYQYTFAYKVRGQIVNGLCVL